MGLYDNFAEVYDLIFPANPKTIERLKAYFSDCRKLLDLGCGTGNYTMLFDHTGREIKGIDLDAQMIQKAEAKTYGLKNVTFETMNMFDLKDQQTYDGVFCIGNTLVHLPDELAIRHMLVKIHAALMDKGKLLIQIINYDRVLDAKITSLDTLENGGAKFVRNYVHELTHIRFVTTLTYEHEVIQEAVKLYPIRANQLKDMLASIGFSKIKLWDGFTEKVFDRKKSIQLVITAQK